MANNYLIRPATLADKQAIQTIWYECFLEHDSKASIDNYFEKYFAPEFNLLLIEDSEIKCCLQINQHDLIFDDEVVPTSYVVGVATPLKYRRQGYMKKLLDFTIDYCKTELHQQLMILQAYNWDIYRGFGFEEAYYKYQVRLNVENNHEYNVATIEDTRHLLNLYHTFTLNKNGYKDRDLVYYENLIADLDIENGRLLYNDDSYLVAYKQENEIIVTEYIYLGDYRLLDSFDQPINIKLDTDNLGGTMVIDMMIKNLGPKDFKQYSNLYINELV